MVAISPNLLRSLERSRAYPSRPALLFPGQLSQAAYSGHSGSPALEKAILPITTYT